MKKSLVVATHGYCFDGLASAVMFTRLVKHIEPSVDWNIQYLAKTYGPKESGTFPSEMTGDENAILDYRYTAHKNLTWYFDHHVSAFVNIDDKNDFARKKAETRVPRFFHDGAYGSCTKLIADSSLSAYSLDEGSYRSLVEWADVVDRAAFASAQIPVERKDPVLQFVTVVEHEGNSSFIQQMVKRLLEEPLEEVALSDEMKQAYAPYAVLRDEFSRLVKDYARIKREVVYVDLSEHLVEVPAKFVTYAEWPNSVYSVMLTRSSTKVKISVGYNPWSGVERKYNIARICERHGGGGHPVVGAVSFALADIKKARTVAELMADELQGQKI